MQDQFQRQIHYLRVSITQRCNLRCQYCMPQEGIEKQSHEEMLSVEEFFQVIQEAVALGIDKIRLTGGEPLLHKGILPLVQQIGQLEGIRDFALTTNGILLEQLAEELAAGGLKRINLSLDTLDPDRYREITRGGKIDQVFRGLAAARKAGLGPIKMNTVLMGGWNDTEIPQLAQLVTDGVVEELRFIELMPIGETIGWAKERFVSNQLVLEQLDLTPMDSPPSSPAQMYTMKNGGKIGLINPVSHKFCSNCNRLRLTADGKLKPCLLLDDEIDLRKILRSGGDVAAALTQVIKNKPKEHNLEEENGAPTHRNMNCIGG